MIGKRFLNLFCLSLILGVGLVPRLSNAANLNLYSIPMFGGCIGVLMLSPNCAYAENAKPVSFLDSQNQVTNRFLAFSPREMLVSHHSKEWRQQNKPKTIIDYSSPESARQSVRDYYKRNNLEGRMISYFRKQIDNFSIDSNRLKQYMSNRRKFWATNYYSPVMTSFTWEEYKRNPKGKVALRDRNGNMVGPILSLKDACYAAIEGSVVIKYKTGGQETYNYETTAARGAKGNMNCSHLRKRFRAAGRVRFKVATGKWGDGVENYKLQPFRSIAIKGFPIRRGQLVFIPEAKGTVITLPSGKKFTHDGFFIPVDTGGGLLDDQIDVFTGTQTTSVQPFKFIKSNPNKKFTIKVVHHKYLAAAMRKKHIEPNR